MKHRHSPWGSVQHQEDYPHGISFVSTSSHGGFLVPKEYADMHFSAAAMRWADSYCDNVPRGYYAFEEDCAAVAVMMEVPETRNGLSQEETLDMFNRICKVYQP